VLIEVYKKKDNIIIRYRDDGIGIDDKALKLLFEPFYTTKRGEGDDEKRRRGQWLRNTLSL
jgi:two-component system NtrC family sensor kinase